MPWHNISKCLFTHFVLNLLMLMATPSIRRHSAVSQFASGLGQCLGRVYQTANYLKRRNKASFVQCWNLNGLFLSPQNSFN